MSIARKKNRMKTKEQNGTVPGRLWRHNHFPDPGLPSAVYNAISPVVPWILLLRVLLLLLLSHVAALRIQKNPNRNTYAEV